ncbi:MAG: hypothetical protein CMJ89_19525 [Planctomycetes bacterium]|nr:hypothetical protein [Planctomycetota bacterium]
MFVAGCGKPVEPTAAPDGERSWAYFQALAAVSEIEIHVDPGLAQKNALVLSGLLANTTGFTAFICEEGDEVDPSRGRIVIGSADKEKAARLATHLDVQLIDEGAGFSYGGRTYAQPGDALIASFADPDRPGLPVVLFFGNDEEFLAEYLNRIPRPWEFCVEIHADGELAYRAPLNADGTVQVDRAVDYLGRREEYWRTKEVIELEGITVLAREVPNSPAWKVFLGGLEGARAAVLRWLSDSRTPEVAAEVWVLDHPEDMESLFGESTDRLENPFHPRAYVPWLPFKVEGANSLARVLARELQGPPAYPWLYDGIAIAAAGKWWGRNLTDWIGHLKSASLMPELTEIVDPRARTRYSPHILQPARGFLFRFLLRGPMKKRGRSLWAGAPLGDRKLAVQFAQAIKKAAVATAKAGKKNTRKRVVTRSEVLASPFRNGIALVDEWSPALHSSYLSRSVGLQLAQAHARGADALSLTVRAASMQRETLVELPGAFQFASATDMALINALLAGRKLKMSAMLSVQPLASPAATWADGGVLLSPDDIEQFWKRYTRIITHYALFCQLASVDILCMGTDLREATKKGKQKSETRELMEEGWKKLIKTARRAFRGALTYGAKLGDELHVIQFWDSLDYVGVCFYPRMAKPGVVPRDGVVERACVDALEDATTLANRWNRPLLIVQAGYPARSQSWHRPGVPRGDFDPTAQKRFLELFGEALHRPRPDSQVVRGVYLWSWPASDSPESSRDGERKPADYGLSGTLAEEALEVVFSKD